MEPVYVRGGESLKYPLLRKVLVTYGGNTAFEDTLDQALNKIFGTDSTTSPPADAGTTPPPTSSNPTVQQALTDAQKAFNEGQDALKKGDWTAYGQAQKDLQDALKRAEDAQAKADKSATGGGGGSKNNDKGSSPSSGPSPSGSSSPSPSGSSSPSGGTTSAAVRAGAPAGPSGRSAAGPVLAQLLVGGPFAAGQRPLRAVVRLQHNGAGWSSSVAGWAHDPEVAGSNPVPLLKSEGPDPHRIRALAMCARVYRTVLTTRVGRVRGVRATTMGDAPKAAPSVGSWDNCV